MADPILQAALANMMGLNAAQQARKNKRVSTDEDIRKIRESQNRSQTFGTSNVSRATGTVRLPERVTPGGRTPPSTSETQAGSGVAGALAAQLAAQRALQGDRLAAQTAGQQESGKQRMAELALNIANQQKLQGDRIAAQKELQAGQAAAGQAAAGQAAALKAEEKKKRLEDALALFRGRSSQREVLTLGSGT